MYKQQIITAVTNVTVFWKSNLIVTNTEIYFLPVHESCTHALSRDTKHLRLDGQVCFYRRLLPMLPYHKGGFITCVAPEGH